MNINKKFIYKQYIKLKMTSKENPLQYFLNLENRARSKLIKRYDKPLSYHDVKMINDILYNEKTHYVEAFKEYLIYEDYSEFLKRFYKASELARKLPKILIFYEKYSKIYANYTVIPESKYMYKNIKRKQKMIDQMQNNDINNSDNEEEEEENEEISNTVFSSKVMNSIYNKTLSSLNKSENGNNTEQSINNFISKINDIEENANKVNSNSNKNADNKSGKKFQKKIVLPIKMNKNFTNNNTNNTNNSNNKPNPKSRIQINKNEKFLNNNRTNNNNFKSKNLDIQFTYSKKSIQNDLSNNNNNQTNNYNNNTNNNHNSNYNSGKSNILHQKQNSNIIYINDYMSKNNNYSNSNSILNNNNNSIGNNTNNSNTFHSQQNSLNLNNFTKQKLKQNIINQYNLKENMSENNINNNINNYFSNNESNIINNLKNNHKYKLSLGETLLKQEKIVLSTNSSVSPNMMKDNLFSSPNNKNNIFVNKKRILLKEKLIEKGYLYPENNSNIDNLVKKIKPNLLMEYNSAKGKPKIIENKAQKNLNKSNKKKYTKKIKDIQSININKDPDNYINSEIQANIIMKKPESHRNYYHHKILSNNNMKGKMMSNTNKGFKITVGLKPDYFPQNYKKAITTHCSPNSSSSNFYYKSPYNKNNIKKNAEKNIKNALEENNKKKVVNYNIINNIQDNSTQINIYTGSDLYKSLHFHNNSVFNSQNANFGIGSFSRSPIGRGIEDKAKNKNNIPQNNYFKSQIKGKEKNKYNLNLKKIIHKKILEADREKGLISERLMTHNRLLEKLEKYFLKNNNEINNKNIKINNYNSNNNKNINHNIINKNINKNNYNRNNILYNNFTKNTNTNSEQHKLITKIISKNFNNSNDNKVLKNKTNNNTPLKKNYNKFLNDNKQNVCLSPRNNEQFRKVSKPMKKQKINYNSLMGNLSDINNFGFDNANKFMINSERNKNYKIIFK